MSNEIPTVRQAFENLLDAIQQDIERKFDKLEQKANGFQEKVNEKRLATLEADLEELNKRKNTTE